MSRYDQPYSGAFYSTNPPNPPAPPAVPGEKRRSGLGAAALVLALLAMLFGWVPILGLVMIPPALLAILLGVVGFVAAVVTGRTGKALPFIASVIGVFALLVPPAATVLFALSVTPWAYTVGMDQMQIELEYDLKKQGVPPDQAERVSSEIGNALRSFARPSQWREGIAAAHRFGKICEDYRDNLQLLEIDDAIGRELAAERFDSDLHRLMESHGANLSPDDVSLITDMIQRDLIRKADNYHQYGRRASQRYSWSELEDTGCCECPGGTCCETE